YQNAITRFAAYPGADSASDHNPLVADFRFQCKLVSKKLSNRRHDKQSLKQPGIRANLRIELDEMCQGNNPAEENTSNEIWNELKFNIQMATENIEQLRKTKTKS
ncbi:hypothetical protein HHI36_019107, partial [Cryptolaemus montrouzieri]